MSIPSSVFTIAIMPPVFLQFYSILFVVSSLVMGLLGHGCVEDTAHALLHVIQTRSIYNRVIQILVP